MPFNTSMPLLYINKKPFKKAGLDPAEAADDARRDHRGRKKLTVKQPAARPTYGFGAAIYGWFLEQFDRPERRQAYCDQGNGRDGQATKVQLRRRRPASPWSPGGRRWSRRAWPPTPASNTNAAQAAFKSGTAGDDAGVDRPAGRLPRTPRRPSSASASRANYPQAQAADARRSDHRRRLAVDRRPGPRRRRRRRVLGVREVPVRPQEPQADLAHRHRLLPDPPRAPSTSPWTSVAWRSSPAVRRPRSRSCRTPR